MTAPLLSENDIKAILQKALRPLIEEIKGLKQEIQKLKQNNPQSQPENTDPQRPVQQSQAPKPAKKVIKNVITSRTRDTIATITSILSKKKTYAEMIREITPVTTERP